MSSLDVLLQISDVLVEFIYAAPCSHPLAGTLAVEVQGRKKGGYPATCNKAVEKLGGSFSQNNFEILVTSIKI